MTFFPPDTWQSIWMSMAVTWRIACGRSWLSPFSIMERSSSRRTLQQAPFAHVHERQELSSAPVSAESSLAARDILSSYR
jgi:hypothetical protein